MLGGLERGDFAVGQCAAGGKDDGGLEAGAFRVGEGAAQKGEFALARREGGVFQKRPEPGGWLRMGGELVVCFLDPEVVIFGGGSGGGGLEDVVDFTGGEKAVRVFRGKLCECFGSVIEVGIDGGDPLLAGDEIPDEVWLCIWWMASFPHPDIGETDCGNERDQAQGDQQFVQAYHDGREVVRKQWVMASVLSERKITWRIWRLATCFFKITACES